MGNTPKIHAEKKDARPLAAKRAGIKGGAPGASAARNLPIENVGRAQSRASALITLPQIAFYHVLLTLVRLAGI
jgi:hypothetical protein